MRKPVFTGSATALVSAFTKDGVNIDAYKRFIEFQIKGGTDALVVCGTTGEASTMSAEEQFTLLDAAVETVGGRVPVIMGVGGNNTAEVIEKAKKAKAAGADALLAVTPYYNKTSQKGLVLHYNEVADATDLPIIVYNVPSRTGVNILPDTMAQIARHPNIYGTKEASGDIAQICHVARLCPDIAIYSGNDDHVLPILSVGGIGVITTTGNVAPQLMHDICEKFIKGDITAARELQLKGLPLMDAMFSDVNPIPVKTALNLMGFNMGPLRLPLCDLDPGKLESLKAVMKDFGLL